MQYLPMVADEVLEQRVLQLLTPGTILSLHEIIVALAGVAAEDQVRQTVADLRQQQLVTMRARRRGLWYLGYTASQEPKPRALDNEDIPQPFRAMLSKRVW